MLGGLLVPALALSAPAAAPCPQGGEQHAPVGLTIVVVDVGQGDGIVLRAPNGVVHVVDAGPDGLGTAAMVPTIDSLQPTSYGFAFLSHYHDDHQGGMDEVLQRPFQFAYDRGDVRRTNTSQATQNYLNAAGTRRRTIGLGQTYALGGGATIRCIAMNGYVVGGGGFDPVGTAQEENSRSLALRLDYGNFSMWFGGDLTGGGNSTADIEGPASLACGDVDVYKVDHHGSNTSTSLELISRLDPEVAVVSAGIGNAYGHPTTTTVNRLVQAAAMRTLLATTRGSSNLIGFAALGRIRIDTDGQRYRTTAQNGDYLDFLVDELTGPPLTAGPIRITEIQRTSSRVPDTSGEYFEIQTLGARPLGLKGMRISNNGATVTIASNLALVPGRPLTFQRDGNTARNGGLPLGATFPFSSIALGDVSDTITLRDGSAAILDQVAYTAGFPGGPGIAAERRDLLGPGVGANFAAAPTAYGTGDRGSPGQRNANDTTNYPTLIDAESVPGSVVLRGAALGAGGDFSILAVSYGANVGFPFLGVQVPIDFDPLLQLFLAVPGSASVLPGAGYRSMSVPMPVPSPLLGMSGQACHLLLDVNTFTVPGVSAPFSFVFQ